MKNFKLYGIFTKGSCEWEYDFSEFFTNKEEAIKAYNQHKDHSRCGWNFMEMTFKDGHFGFYDESEFTIYNDDDNKLPDNE